MCIQEPLLVLDLHLQVLEGVLGRLPAGRPAVRIDTIGRADFRDLLAHGRDGRPRAVVLEVDDKDRLVHLAASLGILHRLEDLLEIDEGVAAGGPMQVARKAVLVSLRDDACYVAEHGLQRAPLPALLVVEEGARGRELELVPILAPRVPVVHARCGDLRHGYDGGLDDIALLESRVSAGCEVRIVLLELNEIPVDLLEARLNFVKLVLVRVVKEASDVVLYDLVMMGDSVELVEQEPQDALHLVDTLDVLLVRAVHVARVHVLELHLGLGTDEVKKLTRAVNRQHERAMLHLL
mmetsp:Transcript_87880/g.226539  ORF Transcript_87880/g.226539 Transcript_87880/m.226539 type:complete len:294 (-) Transcript_87880:91-972(-)